MSSDPTRPLSQWWEQPQGPQNSPAPEEGPERQDEPGHQENPGHQEGQRYQGGSGYKGGGGFQDDTGYQGGAGPQGGTGYQENRGYQDGAGPQGGAGYQGGTGYQENRGYQDGPGYQGGSGHPGGSGYQGYRGSQGSPGYQGGPGYQGNQGNPGYQDYQGNQNYQGAQETQRFPQDQRSQETQVYLPNQGYQPYQQSSGYEEGPGIQGMPPTNRRRRRKWPWITLLVIIVLLVAADRGANAYAEDQMASQFQSSLGLSGKPHVSIEGFPFLTQLIAGKFNQVDITATNETINAKSAGSGLLEIASLTATLHGMHIHGTNSATIDQFNASALITFTALGTVGGIPQGITLSADGPNLVKASIDLGPLSGSAIAKVTKVGSNEINVHLISAGDIPTDALGNLVNFNITIPKLPAGVSIQSVSVTQQGLRITVTGHNTTLSQ